MLVRFLSLLFAFFFVLGVANAEDARLPPPAAETSAEFDVLYAQEINQAEKLGQILFEQKRAATAAAKFLKLDRKRRKSDPELFWLADGEGSRWTVLFLERTQSDVVTPLHSVEVVDGVAISESKDLAVTMPLTSVFRTYMQARETILSNEQLTCTPETEVIFVRDTASDAALPPLLAYLVSSPKNKNELIIGGEIRYTMTADGRDIADAFPLSNGCLKLKRPSNVAVFVVTHSRTPHPVETHVFINLVHDLTLFVLTTQNGAGWTIEQGGITLSKH